MSLKQLIAGQFLAVPKGGGSLPFTILPVATAFLNVNGDPTLFDSGNGNLTLQGYDGSENLGDDIRFDSGVASVHAALDGVTLPITRTVGQATTNPPGSLSPQSEVTVVMTVTGARIGDGAVLTWDFALSGIVPSVQVVLGGDTVSLVFYNPDPVNGLSLSGNIYVRVFR